MFEERKSPVGDLLIEQVKALTEVAQGLDVADGVEFNKAIVLLYTCATLVVAPSDLAKEFDKRRVEQGKKSTKLASLETKISRWVHQKAVPSNRDDRELLIEVFCDAAKVAADRFDRRFAHLEKYRDGAYMVQERSPEA